jgi:chorismate mutase
MHIDLLLLLMNSLSKYREEIDQIDQQIVKLILKRSELASELVKSKNKIICLFISQKEK